MVDPNKVSQIRDALKSFWDEQSISVDGGSTSIDDLVAAMDSMTAVEALIEVEKIVGMDLPSGKVIRCGGYNDEADFIEDLTARVLTYVEEHSI